MAKLKIDFLYRDAGNYKTLFEQIIDTKLHPGAAKLKVKDEVTMGEHGSPSERDFFENHFDHAWDPDQDHNLLEVEAILVIEDD